MTELVKNFEVKTILNCLKNATDYHSYRCILLDIEKELIEEQRKNLYNFKKDPKKYRVIIKNIETIFQILNEELGVYRNEQRTNC